MARLQEDRFATLVIHAHTHQWCWNMVCTTCGHSLFRQGLWKLTMNQSPSDNEWLLKQWEDLNNEDRPAPRSFPKHAQRKLLRLVAASDLERLFEACGVTFTLGAIGLVLHYCREAEARLRVISPFLTHAFNYRMRTTAFASYLNAVVPGDGLWTWNDLERVEGIMMNEQFVPRLDTHQIDLSIPGKGLQEQWQRLNNELYGLMQQMKGVDGTNADQLRIIRRSSISNMVELQELLERVNREGTDTER
jgi:hypothetical protein